MINPLLERVLENVPESNGTIECDIEEEHLDCSLMEVLAPQNEDYVFANSGYI